MANFKFRRILKLTYSEIGILGPTRLTCQLYKESRKCRQVASLQKEWLIRFVFSPFLEQQITICPLCFSRELKKCLEMNDRTYNNSQCPSLHSVDMLWWYLTQLWYPFVMLSLCVFSTGLQWSFGAVTGNRAAWNGLLCRWCGEVGCHTVAGKQGWCTLD